jgi:hypothetical protein
MSTTDAKEPKQNRFTPMTPSPVLSGAQEVRAKRRKKQAARIIRLGRLAAYITL